MQVSVVSCDSQMSQCKLKFLQTVSLLIVIFPNHPLTEIESAILLIR